MAEKKSELVDVAKGTLAFGIDALVPGLGTSTMTKDVARRIQNYVG